MQVLEAGVQGPQVHGHHGLALTAVGLLDRGADPADCFVAGQHAANGKETGLHHRVDVVAHAGLAGHRRGINQPDQEPLGANRLAQPLAQAPPTFSRRKWTVEQQHPAWHQPGE